MTTRVPYSMTDAPRNLKRYGLTGDQDQDATDGLLAAIDETSPGDLLLLPFGIFTTTARLTINKPITLAGVGWGSVLRSSDTGTHIMILVQEDAFGAIDGVRLMNFRIDGNTRGQLDAGILALNNAHGFVIDKLWIEDASRLNSPPDSSGVNGISVSAGTPGGYGSRGVIRDCLIRNTSKAGINWTSEAVSALIIGNTVADITGNGTAPGIQINGGFNARVLGNDVSNTQGPGIYLATDGLGNPARNAIIGYNTVRGCGQSSTTQGDGILATGSGATGRLIITGNQAYDNGTNTNGGSGIYANGHDDLVVTGNLCRNNRWDGIRLQAVSHASVTGNRCTGNNLAGVSFAGGIHVLGASPHVLISDNHCSDSKGVKTQSYGIILATGATLNYLTLRGNHLEGNVNGPLLANAGGLPMEIEMTAVRQTTDGAAQTAQYFTLPDECSAVVTARAVGKQSDASNRATYTREALFQRDAGGAATLQGAVKTLGTDEESDAAWGGLNLAVSGNLAVVQTTGKAATTIDWRINVSMQVV